jgi:hypothetical protein
VRTMSSCWIITGGNGTFPNSGYDRSVLSGSMSSVSSPKIYSVVAVRRTANHNRKKSARTDASSRGCVLLVVGMVAAPSPTHSICHVLPSKLESLLDPGIFTTQPKLHSLENMFVDVILHVLDCCKHVHNRVRSGFLESEQSRSQLSWSEILSISKLPQRSQKKDFE